MSLRRHRRRADVPVVRKLGLPWVGDREPGAGVPRARPPAVPASMRRLAAIRDNFLAKLGLLSGDTLRAQLLDVCGGDTYVVAVQHATAQHRGRHLDVTACQLMRVEDGHIVEVHGHYSDQAALDAFWQK